MIQAFLVALQFLTCLPVRFSTLSDDKTHGYSLLFYPLIGLIIGTLLVLLGWLLSDAPPLLAAALVTTGWVLLTGGLHLDGLADSCSCANLGDSLGRKNAGDPVAVDVLGNLHVSRHCFVCRNFICVLCIVWCHVLPRFR